MASGSRTTTLRQLGAGASNRFTEGLLASGGKLALVGLVASVLTLGYTIWFRAELSHQAKVAAPMALDAVRLNAALNQSFSAVRSWVAYGDPEALSQWEALWREELEPLLDELDVHDRRQHPDDGDHRQDRHEVLDRLARRSEEPVSIPPEEPERQAADEEAVLLVGTTPGRRQSDQGRPEAKQHDPERPPEHLSLVVGVTRDQARGDGT